MPKFTNTYPGRLILPDGTEIASAAEIEIDAATAKNAGVQEWVAAGWLAEAKKATKGE